MSKDNLKITIEFPSLGKKVETDSDSLDALAKAMKKKKTRKKIVEEVLRIKPKQGKEEKK